MTAMTPEELEQAYEWLAIALDEAGPARESLFLARLALTLAHRLGDPDSFKEAIAIALKNIPDAAAG